MKTLPMLFTLLLMSGRALHAGTRSSASYTVPADTQDAGGRRTQSTSYTNTGSVGSVVGLSTGTVQVAKAGYIGQLTEVTMLQLAATPTTVNEGSTRQLSASAVLDDATTLSLIGTDVAWSVQSGPLTSLNTSGLATAAPVYQNTAATIQGSYAGTAGILGLTVVNSLPDNFGTYAGDGIGDGWQVQHFGLNNPNAAPGSDLDLDGLENLLEWACGLDPTLSSTSKTSAILFEGEVVFNYTRSVSAVDAGAVFIVEWSDTLAANDWSTTGVSQAELSNNGTLQQMKATLPAGGSGRRFVRLRATIP